MAYKKTYASKKWACEMNFFNHGMDTFGNSVDGGRKTEPVKQGLKNR